MENLLSDIEAFCAAQNISVSRFGELAMNDKAFVHDLKKKERRVWPETAERVRKFIAEYKREAA